MIENNRKIKYCVKENTHKYKMVKRKRESINPPLRKTARPTKRRKVMRRRRYIPRGPFPLSRVVKLRYMSNQQDLACTSGAIANINVIANQPVYAGQYPYGWNEWSALYNHYVVLGSKITVYQFGQDDSAGSKTFGFVGVYLGDDATNFTDYTTLIENRMGRFCRATSDSSLNKVSHTFSAKKFFNVKDVKDNLDRLGSPVSGSPSELANFKVWAQPINKTSSQTFYCNFLIEWICLFSERKDVAAS